MGNQKLDFILEHQEDLLRFCFFLIRDEVLAQDLAQDTFIRCLKFDKKIENPKAFLFQTARHLHIDTKRREKYLSQILSDEIRAETIEFPDLEVWRTLFSLEQVDQDVLMLIDREGLSASEAAGVLGLSEPAVKSRLIRARENFQKKWNK